MKSSLLFLVLIVSLSIAQANNSAEQKYACYKSLATVSNDHILLDDGHTGIEAFSGQKFYLLTAGGINECRLSSGVMKVKSRGKEILIQKQNEKDFAIIKSTEKNNKLAQDPYCKANASLDWTPVIEQRVSRLRQECNDPDARGMSTAPTCLADFIDALGPCGKVDQWRVWVSELVRSAQASQKRRQEEGIPTEIRQPMDR